MTIINIETNLYIMLPLWPGRIWMVQRCVCVCVCSCVYKTFGFVFIRSLLCIWQMY